VICTSGCTAKGATTSKDSGIPTPSEVEPYRLDAPGTAGPGRKSALGPPRSRLWPHPHSSPTTSIICFRPCCTDGFAGHSVDLDNSLTALTEAVKSAAPSYSGLALTLIIDSQPVSLTSAEPGNTTDIATSLRLSLAWIPSLGADNRITFYAATPGTFVDLAADLTFARDIRLDEDIPPVLASDLTGVGRLSAINRLSTSASTMATPLTAHSASYATQQTQPPAASKKPLRP
jgi:hypothetical protein